LTRAGPTSAATTSPSAARPAWSATPEHFDPAALAAALPPRGGSVGAPPSASSFDDLGIRPEWHEASTPAPVAAACSAVEAAVAAAVDADRAERALDGEEAQAQRTEAARVRSATASGKAVKASAGRDFASERRHRAAIAAGCRDRARGLRGAYDALVEQHREGWAAQLVEQLPAAKASAIEALVDVADRVERLLGAATAAQALLLADGGSVVSLPSITVRQFVEGAQALAAEVEASPQLGGEGLVRPPMTPSWSERQAIGVQLLHGVLDSRTHWLAGIEAREDYSLTAFTQGVPLGRPPPRLRRGERRRRVASSSSVVVGHRGVEHRGRCRASSASTGHRRPSQADTGSHSTEKTTQMQPPSFSRAARPEEKKEGLIVAQKKPPPAPAALGPLGRKAGGPSLRNMSYASTR
jgi:hypothetical protein